MQIERNRTLSRYSVAKCLSVLALLLAVGLLAVPARAQGGSGTYHVFFQANSTCHMIQAYNPGTGWQSQDVTTLANAVAPACIPQFQMASTEAWAGIVDTVVDIRSEHIYYTNNASHVASLYWHPSTGAWSSVDLSQLTGAPFTIGASNPISALLDTIIEKGSKHIYYTAGNELVSLYWHPANGGSWTWVELSSVAGAPR